MVWHPHLSFCSTICYRQFDIATTHPHDSIRRKDVSSYLFFYSCCLLQIRMESWTNYCDAITGFKFCFVRDATGSNIAGDPDKINASLVNGSLYCFSLQKNLTITPTVCSAWVSNLWLCDRVGNYSKLSNGFRGFYYRHSRNDDTGFWRLVDFKKNGIVWSTVNRGMTLAIE